MEKAITTYHRMTEIFKFSHAYRSHLSDPDFVVRKEEFKKVSKYAIRAEVLIIIVLLILLSCF